MRFLPFVLSFSFVLLSYCSTYAGVDSLFYLLAQAKTGQTKEAQDSTLHWYGQIAQHYLVQQQLDSAAWVYEEMMQYSTSVNHKMGIANAYYGFAKTYTLQSKHTEAIDAAVKAAELFEKLDSKKELSATYSVIGSVNLQQGEIQSGLDYYTRAIEVKQAIGDSMGMAHTYHNMAIAHYRRDLAIEGLKHDSARAYFRKSVALLRSMDTTNVDVNRLLLQGLSGIVSMYGQDGDYIRSIKGLENIAKIYRNNGNNHQLMVTLYNLGVTSYKVKRYEAAQKYLDESLAIAQELDNKDHIKNVYAGYVDLYKHKKEYLKAFDYVKLYIDAKDSLLNKESREALSDIRTRYETEKTERENEGLKHDLELTEKENEIQSLQLTRTYYVIFGLIAILVLGGIILILLLQRGRLKTQHKIVELEQKALRAQMNPHFFFNALNSIQSCILHEDKMVAYEYHAKFAKLMRATLINSASKSIAINDELTALKLYMDLEALRLDQKFVYEIEVDEQLDGEKDQIPTMLLQPYIENAIWHGVMHRKTQGTIWLKLQLEADHLKCVIEDNGVGRKQSRAMKAQHGESHQSMGMEVTKERLELYNLEHKSKMSVSIIDLEDATGPLGTRIELFIPKETLKNIP